MLLYRINELMDLVCMGTLAIPVLLCIFAAYTYIVNLWRKPEDPRKGDYHPAAILIVPVTAPFFLVLALLLLLLRGILLIALLFLFTVLLVFMRLAFVIKWWHIIAIKVGDPLLKWNTELIRLAFGSWPQRPL